MKTRTLAPALLLLAAATLAPPADAGPAQTVCVLTPDEYEPNPPQVPVRKETSPTRHGYLTWLPINDHLAVSGQWHYSGLCTGAGWLLYCVLTDLCDTLNPVFYDAEVFAYESVQAVLEADPAGVAMSSAKEVIDTYYKGPRAPPCEDGRLPTPEEPCEPELY